MINLRRVRAMKEQPPSEDWPRGIEIRVIGGGAPASWEPVEEEEVVRLEKTGVAGVRSIEEMKPCQAGPPERRRRRRGWNSHSLSVLMWVLVSVLVVGAATAVIWVREDDPARQAPFEGMQVFYEKGEDPDDPFLKTTAGYLAEARELLARLAEARTAAEAAELVRDGAELRPLLERHWVAPALDKVGIAALVIEVGGDDCGREWAVLSGNDLNGEPLRLVFVAGDGGLVLDWAASVGANPVSLDLFRDSAAGDTADFRLEVSVDHYYGPGFSEEEFRCFKVADVFGDSAGWVYARRGSAVADAVAAELHADGTILEGRQKARMILRLANRGAGAGGQFELIEVLSGNWIRSGEM